MLAVGRPEEVARHASWRLAKGHLLGSLLNDQVEGVVHQIVSAEELTVGLQDVPKPLLILLVDVKDALVHLAEVLVDFDEVGIFEYVLVNRQLDLGLVAFQFFLEYGQCLLLPYVLSFVVDRPMNVEAHSPIDEAAFEVELVLELLFVEVVRRVLHHDQLEGCKVRRLDLENTVDARQQ